eukprot:1200630-Rhodomonas_salina.1
MPINKVSVAAAGSEPDLLAASLSNDTEDEDMKPTTHKFKHWSRGNSRAAAADSATRSSEECASTSPPPRASPRKSCKAEKNGDDNAKRGGRSPRRSRSRKPGLVLDVRVNHVGAGVAFQENLSSGSTFTTA